MPLVDLVDETFVVVPPAALAARLRDPLLWREWWPALHLAVHEDRGVQGMRWTVTGALVGSSEIWLEPVGDGTVVHYYLRADLTRRGMPATPVTGPPGRLGRLGRRTARAYAVAFKRRLNALKDELEGGRLPGVPPPSSRRRPTAGHVGDAGVGSAAGAGSGAASEVKTPPGRAEQ